MKSLLPLALAVSLHALAQLPDLVTRAVSAQLITTDSQTLEATGDLTCVIRNEGPGSASGTAKVLAFEDRNLNLRYDAGDVPLGSVQVQLALAPAASSKCKFS